MASCCVLSMIFVRRSWMCCSYCCYYNWTVGLFDGAIFGAQTGRSCAFGSSIVVLLYGLGTWTCGCGCCGAYTGTCGGFTYYCCTLYCCWYCAHVFLGNVCPRWFR